MHALNFIAGAYATVLLTIMGVINYATEFAVEVERPFVEGWAFVAAPILLALALVHVAYFLGALHEREQIKHPKGWAVADTSVGDS